MLKQKLKINYLSLIFAFLVFIYTLFTQGAQLEIDVILNRSSAIFLFVLSKLLILFFLTHYLINFILYLIIGSGSLLIKELSIR